MGPLGAYASRPTNTYEKNYSAFELEALSIVFSLQKFQAYLEHRHFELHTDNNALNWLLNHPRQIGKIGRWLTLINSFQFTVYHIKGKENVVADCLSRLFEESDDRDPQPTNHAQQSLVLFKIPEAFQDVKTHQQQDPKIKKLKSQITQNRPPPPTIFSTSGDCSTSIREPD